MSDQGPPSDADAVPGAAGSRGGRPGAPPPGAAPARRVKKVAKKAPGTRSAVASSPKAKKAPAPPDDASAALRGYVVIGATIIIGLLFFLQGLQKDDSPTINAGATTSVPLNTPTTDRNAPPPTTAPSQGTTVPPRAPTTSVPPEELKVMVTNGVDPSKTIAGPNATKLTAADYTVVGTGDLPPPAVATSAVYFTPDYEGDAAAVAQVLGIDAKAVQPMPAKPPAQLNGANVLVVIGEDKA